MNKVIFLDVDGVLNNGTWAIEMFDKGIRVYHDDLLYEPSLEQLRRIVDTTGAVIVVSSSWRQIPIAYLHLKERVEKYGMKIYDKTPYVGGERGDDITAWFNRHPGDWKYVILDDDDDMGVHMPHFMRGGTYQIGGCQTLWLNITYNYGKYYCREDVLGENGICAIYGMTGAESIPILENAAAALGDDVDPDYWTPTEGNAKRPLLQLIAIAKMRPDGIWDGD